MKVAFDVQGTLEGHKRPQVIRLARAFIELDCDLVAVWSFGGRQMARDALTDAGLNLYGKRPGRDLACMSKRYKESGIEPEFDLCVDDDHSTAEILDAKKVLYVDDIPTDESEIVALAKRLYDEANHDQARA